MGLDRVAIEVLKSKVDIEQFVRDHFDRVSGSAPQLYARCPGHADGRNSLSIRTEEPNRGQWTCHAGCGPTHQRDLVNLVMMIHGVQFNDAISYLQDYVEKTGALRPAGMPGNSFPVETVEPFKPEFDKILINRDNLLGSEFWKKFLEDRKIGLLTSALFSIGVDKYGNLTIPAKDVPSGETRGLRFRSEDGSRWWAEKSKASQILYGFLSKVEDCP